MNTSFTYKKSEREVREENLNLLRRRVSSLIEDPHSFCIWGIDQVTAEILCRITSDGIELASDCNYPIFTISLTPDEINSAIQNTGGNTMQAKAIKSPIYHLINEENTQIVTSRWAIAIAGDTEARARYGIPDHLLTRLARCTLSDIQKIIRISRPLATLKIQPQYLHHASRSPHWTTTQRNQYYLSTVK